MTTPETKTETVTLKDGTVLQYWEPDEHFRNPPYPCLMLMNEIGNWDEVRASMPEVNRAIFETLAAHEATNKAQDDEIKTLRRMLEIIKGWGKVDEESLAALRERVEKETPYVPQP